VRRCINIQNRLLHFSGLRWNRSLFSELAWNISEFQIGFLIASCSFHFGVSMEFSIVAKSTKHEREYTPEEWEQLQHNAKRRER
jgi:hypothetical protein